MVPWALLVAMVVPAGRWNHVYLGDRDHPDGSVAIGRVPAGAAVAVDVAPFGDPAAGLARVVLVTTYAAPGLSIESAIVHASTVYLARIGASGQVAIACELPGATDTATLEIRIETSREDARTGLTRFSAVRRDVDPASGLVHEPTLAHYVIEPGATCTLAP